MKLPDTYSPSVRVRRIARALRDWRETSGAQSGVIAKRAGWSAAKQSRLETGGQAIAPADVMTLALIYEVPEGERNRVFNAAMTAQEKGWWEELAKGALIDDVTDYVELETEATLLRSFKVDLILGVFQTRDYAEAITRAHLPPPDEETIQTRVEARMRRQTVLARAEPLAIEAVFAECALRVPVGGPAAMRAQLARLIELGELPNIRIRVLPNAVGAHPGMGAGFNILSFGGEVGDVVYLEFLHKGVYMEEPSELSPYKLRFDGLWDLALSEAESAEFIAEIARTMAA